MSWVHRLAAIDRRIIFLLIFVGALVPVIWPIGLAVRISPPVRAVYERIEALSPGDAVLLSFDYGPPDGPELDPMANSILRHCMKKQVRVIGTSFYSLGGPDIELARFRQLVTEMDARPGVDFANLGYKDGAQAALRGMGESFASIFPVDVDSTRYDQIPATRGVRNYHDCKLAISFCTSIIGEYWVNLVNAQFGIPVAVGTTAVSAPRYYAFLESKQIFGLIGGMKGASEYEELAARAYPDVGRLSRTATLGMDVQSIVHAIIILLIVLGNVVFLFTRGKRAEGK